MAVSKQTVLNALATFKSLQDNTNEDKFAQLTDFTPVQTKVSGIAEGAQVNVLESVSVDGTVTAVYFEPGNTDKSSFAAYVSYDHSDDISLIKLDNIVKHPTSTNKTDASKRVYRANETAAASLNVYDTRNGSFEQLQGDTFTGKFVTITSAQAASLDSQLRSDSA